MSEENSVATEVEHGGGSRKVSHQEDESLASGSRRTSIMNQSRRGTLTTSIRKSLVAHRDSFWRSGKAAQNKNVHYENTYRIEPKASERISRKKIEDLLQEVLYGSLTDATYEPMTAQTLSKNLANLIRKKLREMFPNCRYKFIVLVNIGSSKNTSIVMASRACWYVENGDTFAEASFKNSSIFGVVSVFATYYE